MVESPLKSVMRRLRGLVGTAPGDNASDGELLQLFLRERDEAAFAQLLERHGALVRGVCRYLLNDPADQDDAFQATFVLLVRKGASVRRVDSLAPWLHRVACRVALTARRTAARRRTHERQVPSMTPADPLAEAERHDWAPVLHEEVDRLPEKYRRAVVLCYLEGKSTAEAAELLHWPVGTVKVRLLRAREMLQRRLIGRGLALTPAVLAALFAPGAATAAVSPALMQATLKAAAAVAAGTASAAVAPTVATLVEGVARTMFLNKLKVAAAAVLLFSVLGGSALWLGSRATVSAVPVVPVAEKDKPGQIFVGKPDKNGMVTMFRPIVSQLAPGDPIKLALHWGLENGPIPADFQNKTIFSSVVPRDATLASMTFTIITPDGKQLQLQPKVTPPKGPVWGSFYYQPTFILTLSPQGVQDHTGLTATWGGKQAKLDLPGVYQVKIAGNIVLQKGNPLPFETGNVALELNTPNLKTLAEAEAAARAAVAKKGHKLQPGVRSLVEDAKGNRLVKLHATIPQPPVNPMQPVIGGGPGYLEFVVPVSPLGNVGTYTEEKKGGCVARGTLVDTSEGPRPIETIQPGTRIWGYDPARQERVLTTVRALHRLNVDRTYTIGGTLRVSAEHPLYVNGAWQPAAVVKAGDKLLTPDGRTIRTGEPKITEESIEVYDLSVTAPHTFFAGGFLVHNKSMAWTPYLADTYYHLWPPVGK